MKPLFALLVSAAAVFKVSATTTSAVELSDADAESLVKRSYQPTR